MCLVTPKRPDQPWWPLLSKHFKAVKVYEKTWRAHDGKSKLFSRPKQNIIKDRVYPCAHDASREECRSSPYDIVVWFSNQDYTYVQSVQYKEPKDIGKLTTFKGSLAGHDIAVLLDGGAQVNMINPKLVQKLQIP
jgi:hypothetical protein